MKDLNNNEKLIAKLLTLSSIVLVNTVFCYTLFNIIGFGIPHMPWLAAFVLSLLGMIVALALQS